MENVTIRKKRRGRSAQPLSEAEVNFTLTTATTTSKQQQSSLEMAETFRKAVRRTSQASFWKAHDHLVDAVLAASQLDEEAPSGDTILSDSASLLLSSCRSLVKNEPKNQRALLVACHTLRALTSIKYKCETTVRLLYHVTVNSSGLDHTGSSTIPVDICCLAYRALAKIFPSVFPTKTLPESTLFPVPRSRLPPPSAKVPLDQAASIALFATFAVARTISMSQCSDYLLLTKPTLASSSHVTIVRDLILNTAVPWMEVADHDTNSPSYTKKAFRILWDTPEKHPKQKLLLQKDALVLFAKHYPDDACTYAWKIAHAYHSQNGSKPQTTNRPSTTLQRFHNELGPVLDRAFAATPSLPYAEYCAYRMLHGTVVDALPTALDTDCVYGPFLKLFQVAVQLQNGLEKSTTNEIAMLISNLQGTSATVPTRLRLSKLFSALKLHRLGSNSQGSSENLGHILSGIGEFCLVLTNDVDGKIASTLWTLGVESYKQSILCLGTRAADEAMGNLLKTMTNKRSPVAYVENCAKFLSALGRRRFDNERASDAILPLLYSIQLLLQFAPTVPPSAFCELQLSSRFSMIATVYRSLGDDDEVVLATMASVLLVTIEDSMEATEADDNQVMMNLVEYLCNLSREVIYTGSTNEVESKTGMIHTILKLLSVRERTMPRNACNVPSTVGLGSVVDVLLRTKTRGGSAAASFQSLFREGFHLSGILSAFLPSLMECTQNDGANSIRAVAAQIKLLALFQSQTGKCLQGMDECDLDTAIAFVDYNEILLLADACLTEMLSSKPSFQYLLRGAFYTAASTSILSTSPLLRCERWCVDFVHNRKSYGVLPFLDQALSFVDQSLNCLDKVASDPGYVGVTATSLHTSMKLYRLQLSSQLESEWSLDVNLADIHDAVRRHLETREQNRLTHLAQQCIVRHLVRLYALFSLNGENLLAIQVSRWSCDTSSESWFQTMLMSQILASSYGVTSKLDDFDDVAHLEDSHCSHFEARACQLRFRAASEADFMHLERAFRDSFDETDALLAWAGTTISLGISEGFERRGCLVEQLDSLKDCFQSCEKLLQSMKQDRRKNSPTNGLESWILAAIASLPARCIERQIACLQKIAILYSRLGSYRRAAEYAHRAIRATKSHLSETSRRTDVEQLLDFCQLKPTKSVQEMRTKRLLVLIRSRESSVEMVSRAINETADDPFLLMPPVSQGALDETLVHVTESTRNQLASIDLLNGHVLFPFQDNKCILDELPMGQAIDSLSSNACDSLDRQHHIVFHGLQSELELRKAALSISNDTGCDPDTEQDLIGNLTRLSNSLDCSNDIRSWSSFLLGTLFLRRARESGELEALWSHDSVGSEPLSKAKMCFAESLKLLGSSTGVLKRSVMRSLALVTGPSGATSTEALSTAELITCSVGDASLQEFSRNGIGLADRLKARLQIDWRVVSAVLCSTGEVLVSSIDYSEDDEIIYNTACLFPETPSQDCFSDIVLPLCEIIKQNEDQLNNPIDIADGASREDKKDIKRNWWQKRQALDDDLAQLIQSVESRFLSSEFLHEVLVGSLPPSSSSFEISCRDLSSKFAAASLNQDSDSETSSLDLESMTMAALKEELQRYGVQSKEIRKARKSHLVELLTEKRQDFSNTPSAPVDVLPSDIQNPSSPCTFLILDEHLQRFPFEGMACFKHTAVCRLPALSFLLSESNGGGLSYHPKLSSYILDPEANLSSTRTRLQPLIKKWEEAHGATWSGIVGDVPSSDFLKNAVARKDGLLLYFGHGGGQQFNSRKMVEESIELSSVILMGCSSGKLESVNSKGSKSLARHTMHYAPEGVALSYLQGGAKCVVANLWDVTDRDIDRFTTSFLGNVFDTDNNESIATNLAKARSTCKLSYLNGCAPVCYGLPVVQKGGNFERPHRK